jgi:hypothetical protein
MKLFRRKRERESGEQERELVLDTEAEEQAPGQDDSAAPPEQRAAASEGDLLTRIGAEADSEMEAEEAALKGEGGSSQGDDSLDPGLLDIFRDAKNEVQESTLAAELEDVPVQDLLSDLLGLSRSLARGPRARTETGEDSK